MIEKKDSRQIGLLVKTHGINGEFVLRLFNEFTIDDMQVEFLFLDIDGGLVPFFMESAREKNDSDVLIKLESIGANEDAERYIDKPVYVKKSAIVEQKSEGFTTYQLIGYQAYDEQHGHIGEIDAIREITNNPLFEIVSKNGNEFMVPITNDFIKAIDDEKKEIYFDLPEGLVDIDDIEETLEE